MPDTELHLPPEVVQVGRQPILDKKLNVYGYELLYRSTSDSQQGFDGDVATARTVLNSFLEFGLHRLVGKHRVFINMTERFFTEFTSLPVDPQQIVIEVLEDFDLTPAVIDGIKKLHEAGYAIALDDYRFEQRWIPLLPYCALIKVEILGLDLEKYVEPINDLLRRGITLLAEKVETREEYETAKRLGFTLFQGYFFAKPQTLSTTRNPGNRKILLRTIAQLNDPNADIEEVAKLIELDPNLSFKLLRVINSAAQGLTRKISSIREAVVFIGLNRLRAWSTLFVMASMEEASPELITTSLVRAEMCRALADEFDSGHPDSGYTIGLLSTLDAMLNQPMEQLLEEIPLADHMVEALGRHSGPFGNSLQCAIDLERCHWMSESTKLLPVEQLNTMYVHALERVEQIRGVFSAEKV
ncbi:MAG: HDOD domain-containing protein [Candidatus Thiodiazotropha sp. 'RUGA']|nr:HDOD domain-containing protein [Candidatus Thiodiazotropha sp. 'RUGA']